MNDPRPLVAHVMYRFDTGGLENGIVNLINHMPADRYRHAVIALTEVTDFRQRISARRRRVHFPPQSARPWHLAFPATVFTLFRRKLRPAIVHSRNLAALEVQLPAWASGRSGTHSRRTRPGRRGPRWLQRHLSARFGAFTGHS